MNGGRDVNKTGNRKRGREMRWKGCQEERRLEEKKGRKRGTVEERR